MKNWDEYGYDDIPDYKREYENYLSSEKIPDRPLAEPHVAVTRWQHAMRGRGARDHAAARELALDARAVGALEREARAPPQIAREQPAQGGHVPRAVGRGEP